MWLTDLFDKITTYFNRKEEGMPDVPGLVESPKDFLDAFYGTFQDIREFPPEYMTPYKLKVTHQGTTPHCVGHAGALIKAEKERREGHFVDFDPDWLYHECKKIDGMPNVRGTYFRAVLKVLQKKGAMPVGETDLSIAEKYRIGAYEKLEPLTLDNIKSGIYQNGLVLSGFRGSNQGWNKFLNGHIRPPKVGERIWGHATDSVGYKAKVIGQNSWGKHWGDEGMFYYDENYMPFEAWVVLVDLPNNWKELLGIKEKPQHTFNKDLYYPMVDPEVKILQECLKYEGCFPTEVESIENFGPLTLYSVKRFQQKHNIQPVLGYVGPLTRAKLNELFS